MLRHDQGDDIVSEGQAYGMLIAELAGRQDLVSTIWDWTRTNMQREDKLLAFHADADGKILDQSAATDADVLAAYALLRYDGDDADRLHDDGRALASAVLDHETTDDEHAGLVPVAGDWATTSPAVVNPSYWMPSVFDELGQLTGDARWSQVATTSIDLVDQLTRDGATLPPDWGQLTSSGPAATAAPSGSPDVQYGLDAQRVPIWFANDCSSKAQDLAGSWWSLLQESNNAEATALSLDGRVIDATTNPVPLLAAAASATASGDETAAASLTRRAETAAAATPTYYGDAWLALAAGLTEGALPRAADPELAVTGGACSTGSPGSWA